MDKLFITILNMSLTGAFVIAAICAARFALKKTPKIITYCLWAVAWFRLAVPYTIESIFSLVPFKAQTIPYDVAAQRAAGAGSGLQLASDAANKALQSPQAYLGAGDSPLRLWSAIGSWVWLAGAAVMVAAGVTSYIRFRHKMDSAIRVEENLYETDGIRSPFVMGILKPKIYIPPDLSGKEREYIMLHERTHIRRHDYLIKFAAYFILCLHWFNPLAWVAFALMGVDMEMSCDESVLKRLGGGIKKDYSASLLFLAVSRSAVGSPPLAFGEEGVKSRIKNVLKYKKTPRVAVVLAIAVVLVLSVGLAAGRAGTSDTADADSVTGEVPGGGNYEEAGAQGAAYVYSISDYYNNDGTFSALGLALDEVNSEKALSVSRGDILIVGERQYEITVDSLTLNFYTQPSLDQVIIWWTDYLDSWVESGKAAAGNY